MAQGWVGATPLNSLQREIVAFSTLADGVVVLTIRDSVLVLSVASLCFLTYIDSSYALNGPTSIEIDGGSLGQFQLSVAADGYAFFNSPSFGNQQTGMEVGETSIEVQKNTGIIQFTINVASLDGQTTLGTQFYPASIDIYTTGPLYEGYITIAPPNTNFTISAGQIDGIEGYESAFAWNDPSQFVTALYYVESGNGRGISATYSKGPLSTIITFGDGWDTGVFNYLQVQSTYTFDSTNALTLFYGGNLGTQGRNADLYGEPVSDYAAGPNSQMLGAWYVYTKGNLTLTPEVQGQFAKADFDAGIIKPTWNFGAALFYSYDLGSSPFSIGGWSEYFTSHSSAADNFNWFVGPDSQAVGIAVSPTWQHKNLYARANLGDLFLLHNTDATGKKFGYGSNGRGRNTIQGTFEVGLLY